MTTKAQVAAFEGGQLRVLASDSNEREAVLALPLNRLLVKMVRVPPETDSVAFATPVLQAMSPFPDEPLTVSCEMVRTTESGTVVLAAALPESAADDIGEALDAQKLNVVRVDALVLGQLRGVWTALGEGKGRRLVIVQSVDCVSVVILDDDQPSAIRAISDGADLRREVMLSLLEAEDFGGVRKLEEIVVIECGDEVASAEVGGLSDFAPVRTVRTGSDAALVGVGERTDDPSALNALPASWREVLDESRFKRKLVKRLAIAGGIWIAIIGIFFAVPFVYNLMTDHQKALSRQHARQYAAVKEMKAKVDLVRKYSDHARGALEIIKAVSDRLPEGVTLSSWDYRREDGVRIKGEAETAEAVYALKDALDALSAGEDDEADRVFGSVTLTGPNPSKGKQSFGLDCLYQKDDEGE